MRTKSTLPPRPDLNVAMKPDNPKIRNELISMIVQYLEDSGYIASALNLRDDMRLIIAKESSRCRLLLKLRSVIKSGDWTQIEPLTNELSSSPKLLYSILRHRFFELLSSGDTSIALQFLSTRLREYRGHCEPPNDYEELCYTLVEAASPSQSPQLPDLSLSLQQILDSIDKELKSYDSPIYEKNPPDHRLVSLLQQAVKFQIGRFEEKGNIESLLVDYQPSAIPNGIPKSMPQDHNGNIKCLAFVPGTSTLISGSSDKTAIIWDAANWTKKAVLNDHDGRIWSIAAGNDIVTTACSDGIVRLYNITSTNMLAKLSNHNGDVYSVDTDIDGRHIVSGGYDQNVIVWDTPTQAPETILKGHSAAVTAVIYDPIKNLVVSGGKDLTVQLWDVRSYLAIMQLTPVLGEVTSISADPSFTRILAATKDSTNRIWDLRKIENVMLLKGHQNSSKHFVRARFGPNGKTVISGSDDGKIHAWDSFTGKPIKAFRAHQPTTYDVVWSSHAHVFASCGDDSNLFIWEPAQL